MDRLTENKLILIVRETRLEELKARFNTVGQARFYIRQLGGDFADYEAEDTAYRQAVAETQEALGRLGRVQLVHRAFLPNFIFGPGDLAVALGQDGLVANALKYLDGQPLIGVNPDPARYDGQLLPFQVRDLPRIVPEVFRHLRPVKAVTMARASLSNGQKIYAVNDLFIGPKSHGSARYRINHNGSAERHSSSGVIVSTGLGSTGWLRSLIAGATGVAAAVGTVGAAPDVRRAKRGTAVTPDAIPRAKWDADRLFFTVREPFPSRTTQATLVFGEVSPQAPLEIESFMAERGVIFSDGIEADFLEFNSGLRASIGIAERKGRLVA
ncbi:MAG: sugar kinase [Lacunisphaera sp.]